MDMHLTIPLWPLAAILSIVVAGIVSAFVSAFEPAHPLTEESATVGRWAFWVVAIVIVGWCMRGIWIVFGYPTTANVIAILYASVCVLYWIRSAWGSMRRRIGNA